MYFLTALGGVLVPELAFFAALIFSAVPYYALMKLWILDAYPQKPETEGREATPATD